MICPNPECPDCLSNGFPGEYVDGITTCPVCGHSLVPPDDETTAEPGPHLVDSDVDVVEIFSSPRPTEVVVVRALLDGAGIPYLVDLAGDVLFPGLTASIRSAGGVSICVRAEDLEAATALIEEHPLDTEQETAW